PTNLPKPIVDPARLPPKGQQAQLCTASGTHCGNLVLCLAKLGQDPQGFRGLGLVDPAHGKADMHQDPGADEVLRFLVVLADAGDIDHTLDPAEVGNCQIMFSVLDAGYPARNAKAHGASLTHAGISRAAPTTAWPNDRPPSFVGT